MLRPYDIVVINPDFDDPEVRGKRGHVIGEVTADQIGVFVYDAQMVWCCRPGDVTPTGMRDTGAEAEAAHGLTVRVSQRGEVLD